MELAPMFNDRYKFVFTLTHGLLNVLGFTKVKGNHRGVNMVQVIVQIVDRYDLREKVRLCLHECLP